MLGRTARATDRICEIKIPLLSKTVQTENSKNVGGADVATHCRIAGFVAEELLALQPEWLKENSLSPKLSLVAACHDIGKISPDFQKMIYANIDGIDADRFPELESADAENAGRTKSSFHAKVTQTALANIAPQNVCIIEGMHHGFHPSDAVRTESAYGGEPWTKKRRELLSQLEQTFAGRAAGTADEWPELADWFKAGVAGGFVIVCDWIASGGEFAALLTENGKTDGDLRLMAKKAVEKAGFRPASFVKGLSFQDLFGFAPRPVQKAFYESVRAGGVYILEAPMGLGKTEAALYAAYRMLADGKATGLYFALPTQLTSDRIYERVRDFLSKAGGADKSGPALKLLHGDAWLTTEMGADADAGRSWFDGKKRGILAPFAVGTVDQALMAVMNVRHGMVRAFGLAGKVVILDEVHSYDSYTGTILNTLVSFLRGCGCTVLILSATLTAAQKRSILQIESENLSGAYPLISCVSGSGENRAPALKEIPAEGGKGRTVSVQFEEDWRSAAETALSHAERGEQVLWIENTVAEAQAVFKTVSAKCAGRSSGIECGLIHSRFTKKDRALREEKWTGLYGKKSDLRNQRGRILVGTQVLEQSLDIDADFLVTKLCPTDMLLQRAGRLWRHTEHDAARPAGSGCGMVIIAPDCQKELTREDPFGKSGAVYSPYVLFRTLRIWRDRRTVSLPDDIRPLLESTYREIHEDGRMQDLKTQLLAKKQKLEGMARISQSSQIQVISDDFVRTRYSEQDTCKVLLLRTLRKPAENEYEITFADEKNPLVIKGGASFVPAAEKKKIARAILEHCVPVSEKNAPAYEKRAGNIFSQYIYTGSESDGGRPFRAAVLAEDGALRGLENQELTIGGQHLYYDDRIGYRREGDF